MLGVLTTLQFRCLYLHPPWEDKLLSCLPADTPGYSLEISVQTMVRLLLENSDLLK